MVEGTHPLSSPVTAKGAPAAAMAPARQPLLHRALLPQAWERDPGRLRRQLQWLIGIRLVVVTSIVLLYFLLTLLPEEPLAGVNPQVLFLLTGLTYSASLLYIFLLSMFEQRVGLLAYAQFLGDILLITALVYSFGGVGSPFSMLYLIVISIAAVLLRRRAAVLVANIAYLLYSGTVLGLYYGLLPPPTTLAAEVELGFGRLAYQLATHLVGFYGVAMLTSYLARHATLAERELEEKREDLADLQVVYQDVVQSISSGLMTTDPAGRITSINRTGEQLLHCAAGGLLGQPVWETRLLDEQTWLRHVGGGGSGERMRNEVEVQLGPGAHKVTLGYTLAPLTDAHGAGKGYILIFQDLTEWRALQDELRLKDRMAAVGELAAGIAHEIGNPLAAISGSVQLLSPSTDADPQRAKLLDIVLRESQRLDRTIKSFLQFARPKERSSVRFDIAHLIRDNLELLTNSREIGEAHRVEVQLDPPSTTLLADPDQISQIFWNLVRNALRAMPNGGTLRVVGLLQETVYRLQVCDTGRGMGDEERARLFHPFKSFFDGGTGIGMAIVYRIIEEHHGRLLVESAPGEGTVITVELPVTGAVAAGGRAGA
ncbi:MAG TPA: ATP-binding protein [Thermoanaerobaculia bacterium]|nr:ATP-binding protein [Thermoanaerobaculia bacterium]